MTLTPSQRAAWRADAAPQYAQLESRVRVLLDALEAAEGLLARWIKQYENKSDEFMRRLASVSPSDGTDAALILESRAALRGAEEIDND